MMAGCWNMTGDAEMGQGHCNRRTGEPSGSRNTMDSLSS